MKKAHRKPALPARLPTPLQIKLIDVLGAGPCGPVGEDSEGKCLLIRLKLPQPWSSGVPIEAAHQVESAARMVGPWKQEASRFEPRERIPGCRVSVGFEGINCSALNLWWMRRNQNEHGYNPKAEARRTIAPTKSSCGGCLKRTQDRENRRINARKIRRGALVRVSSTSERPPRALDGKARMIQITRRYRFERNLYESRVRDPGMFWALGIEQDQCHLGDKNGGKNSRRKSRQRGGSWERGTQWQLEAGRTKRRRPPGTCDKQQSRRWYRIFAGSEIDLIRKTSSEWDFAAHRRKKQAESFRTSYHEFQPMKHHPHFRVLRATPGAERLASRSHTLTDAGLQSLPQLHFLGCSLIGSPAGVVNTPNSKGTYSAMQRWIRWGRRREGERGRAGDGGTAAGARRSECGDVCEAAAAHVFGGRPGECGADGEAESRVGIKLAINSQSDHTEQHPLQAVRHLVPTQDITWTLPEGGGGPKYSALFHV
ncbi:hypothetical protein DFH09DRAFT_1083353 [Mycena vulgaris]|nr:hypothetical protein DFH09DRAFT_1083353 [Mycena vulgaris]